MVTKKIDKFLVPLDGSKNSLRGLKFALDLARQSGASIIGLNVYSFPTFVKTSVDLINKKKDHSKKIIDQSDKLSKKAKVSFSGLIRTGENIGKSIVAIAQSHKVDMIIIGSRGPDPEGGLFLGSVANYVIHKSKVPVTIIK